MTERYNHQFADVFEYAKENIFNDRPQFGQVIAEKLKRHGYIHCNEEAVLNYIKGMLIYSKVPFSVDCTPGKRFNDYKIEIV